MLSYLVAEDFFAACGEEARNMVPAVVSAVKVGEYEGNGKGEGAGTEGGTCCWKCWLLAAPCAHLSLAPGLCLHRSN